MIDVKITVDAKKTLDLLEKATSPALVGKIANAVADEDVLPALRNYPPQSGKPMPMTTKQRRAFFAKLRSGAIQVPYRRTGAFGRSFQKEQTAKGVDLVSNLAYAPYVRGPGQAAYHKGNWEPLEVLAESLEGDAALTATGVIVKELE